MDFVIGVDGGGTRTRGVCLSIDGTVRGVGEAGPSNTQRLGVVEAVAAVTEAVTLAVRAAGLELPAKAAAVCLAGMGRQEDRLEVEQAVAPLGLATRLLLDSDAEAALVGAHGFEPGIVVIAGTGAVALGRDERGNRVRADGYGPVLGDEGGGYWIGTEVLRAVARAADGRGQPTALSRLVLQHLGVDSVGALIRRLPLRPDTVTLVAALARICARAEQEGDEVGRKILLEAGERLGRTAAAVARRLNTRGAVKVAALGGVLENLTVLSAFQRALAEEAPQTQLVAPRLPALGGAALLALKSAGVEVDDGLVERIAGAEAIMKRPLHSDEEQV